jgi:uncharacterized protein YoxC
MHPYDATIAYAGHVLLAQVVVQAGWLSKLSEVLHALMTLAILVLAVAVVPAAWNFRKSYQKISDLLDRVYADVNPLTHHASRIAENVDYVTTALRADVQRASATLSDADRRLQDAIRQAESRVRDFDALLAVVQDETEGAFVSTASTVRGMRSGMQTLRDTLQLTLRDVQDAAAAPVSRPATRRPRRPALPADDVMDEVLDEVRADLAAVDVRAATPRTYGTFDESADDAMDDPTFDDDAGDEEDFEDEETVDGSIDEYGAARPERPRVRPRRGPNG